MRQACISHSETRGWGLDKILRGLNEGKKQPNTHIQQLCSMSNKLGWVSP